MISVEKNQDLGSRNTFSVPARCDYYACPGSVDELRQLLQWAGERGIPWLMLGEGSNVLFTGDRSGLVIRAGFSGIRFQPEPDGDVLVHADAGVNWHALVKICLERGAYGLENLALIPGSVGAAPVQNIGAYGVELSDVLDHLEVLDVEQDRVLSMTTEQCQFGYRESIFKQSLAGRTIITRVVLRLSGTPHPVVRYPALAACLRDRNLLPTPTNIFQAVCDIRRSRLPDPKVIGNAGSFFRNPVVERSVFDALCRRLSDEHGVPPGFPVDGADNLVKVPAAWLIEKSGWKGFRAGDAGVHDRQALVLVNHGTAQGGEIAELARKIADSVESRFGIRLEPEVTIL